MLNFFFFSCLIFSYSLIVRHSIPVVHVFDNMFNYNIVVCFSGCGEQCCKYIRSVQTLNFSMC